MHRLCAWMLVMGLPVAACSGSESPPAAPVAATPVADQPRVEPTESSRTAGPVAKCDDGDACFRGAMAALRSGDSAAAARQLRAGCQADHARACFKLGELIRDGRITAATPGEGDESLARACRQGHTAACDAMGH